MKKEKYFTIVLNRFIDDEAAGNVIGFLLDSSKEDPKKPILIHLCTPGGVVTEGLNIVNVMNAIPNEVAVVCSGRVYSSGLIVAASGTKGKRFSFPYTNFLYHPGSFDFHGKQNTETIKGMHLSCVHLDEMFNDILLVGNKKLTRQKLEEMQSKEYYFTAQEALSLGFIDHRVSTFKEIENILDKK